MMRTGRTIIMAAALVMLLTSAGAAAPKVDPELTARLASAQSVTQLGVILTFDTDRITDAQVGQVNALGITTGVRMRNFPIMAVNATPAQVRALINSMVCAPST